MKRSLVALAVVLAYAVLSSPVVRAAEGKADGPGMKETLKWIESYLNTEAGGEDVPEGRGTYFKYVFRETKWSSPAEATVCLLEEWRYSTRPSTERDVSFNLKDLDPDGIHVRQSGAWHVLVLPIAGRKKEITIRWFPTFDGKRYPDVSISEYEIYFLKEEPAKKASRAFRHAALLAGARSRRDSGASSDPFAADQPGPANKAPSNADRLRLRTSIERQIIDIEARLPEVARRDAENARFNRERRREHQQAIAELNAKSNIALANKEFAKAAALEILISTRRQLMEDSSQYRDEDEANRLRRQLADLKRQLLDLADRK